jgi:hypothetical protein
MRALKGFERSDKKRRIEAVKRGSTLYSMLRVGRARSQVPRRVGAKHREVATTLAWCWFRHHRPNSSSYIWDCVQVVRRALPFLGCNYRCKGHVGIQILPQPRILLLVQRSKSLLPADAPQTHPTSWLLRKNLI